MQRGKSKSQSAVAKAAKAASASQIQGKRKKSEPTTLLEKEALAAPAKRARSSQDMNRAIQKIVYDNLRSMTNEQLHVVTVDGMTCWETLLRDKPLADGGLLSMGKNYYKNLRNRYGCSDGEEQLTVLDPSQAIDELLLEAITEIKKHNANPAPLLAWLQSGEGHRAQHWQAPVRTGAFCSEMVP